MGRGYAKEIPMEGYSNMVTLITPVVTLKGIIKYILEPKVYFLDGESLDGDNFARIVEPIAATYTGTQVGGTTTAVDTASITLCVQC